MNYGQIRIDGKQYYTHRLSYLVFVGPINDSMTVDHKCGNARCFNPEHLQLLTQQENSRLSPPALKNAEKTHCWRGHEFTDANIYWSGRWRQCATCRAIRMEQFKAKHPGYFEAKAKERYRIRKEHLAIRAAANVVTA